MPELNPRGRGAWLAIIAAVALVWMPADASAQQVVRATNQDVPAASDVPHKGQDDAPHCYRDLAGHGPYPTPGLIVRNLRLRDGESVRQGFPEGESLAEVLRLPAFKKPYQVEFWLSFDLNLRKDNEVLVPSVVLLDGDFCVVENVGEPEFKPEASFFTGTRQTKGRFPIDDDRPKYVIVYTDPRRVGKHVRVSLDGFGYDFVRSGQGYVMVRLNK